MDEPTLSSTISIMTGFGAGGGTDLLARFLADHLGPLVPRATLASCADTGTRIDQPQFTVDMRSGLGGRLAVRQLLNASADGTTLLLAPYLTPVLSQLIHAHPGFDPAVDLAPVGLVGRFHLVLAVPAEDPARDLGDWVARQRSQATPLTCGTGGAARLPHLLAYQLCELINVPLAHRPYHSMVTLLADLVAARIGCAVVSSFDMHVWHNVGKLRALATFAPHRLPELPRVTTMAQAGYPALTGSGWYSLWVHHAVERARITRLNGLLNELLRSARGRDGLAKMGLQADPTTPEALEQLRLAELERWRTLVARSRISGD